MIYSILVSAGLENIARQEIIARFGETEQFKILMRKPQRIVFQYSGNPKHLLSLRTAAQLFLVIKHIPNMTRSRRSLSSISGALSRFNFRKALDCCRQVGIKVRKRVMFRVTSRMSGFRNFQKRDLQQVVERVLLEHGWQLTQADSALTVWAEVHGNDGYISIRLSSSADMAQRTYKQVRVPASLKPTLAYSMVQLAQPHPNDIFLDPMCGAGTILLERACVGRYRYLIGGDISTEAVAATVTNFGRQHQPRQFFHWDAQTLPLQPNTIDKIVCNLPLESAPNSAQLVNFYGRCLDQFTTVLKPGGKMVLLTSQPVLLEKLLKQHETVKTRQRVNVDVGSKRGRIFVVHNF